MRYLKSMLWAQNFHSFSLLPVNGTTSVANIPPDPIIICTFGAIRNIKSDGNETEEFRVCR